MKLYRFIGQDELNKILKNETLENDTDWSLLNDTNSVGFCFFAYNRTNDMRKVVSMALEDWLNGIVTEDYIIEIETEKAKKSYGYYACGKKSEYNLTQYSKENVKHIYSVKKLNVKDWFTVKDMTYTYGVEKIF